MALPKNYELYTLPVPYILWYFTFLTPYLDFWTKISISTALLLGLAYPKRKNIRLSPSLTGLVVGVVSALALYSFFWSGYQVAKEIPGFTQTISSVYDFRNGAATSTIAILLLFPTAPGEEVYWRGFIQRRLGEVLSPAKGLVLASVIYSSIHLATLNPSLMLVALIGGLVWGYIYIRSGNVFPALVSHIVFDELIFVFFVIR
jgi:membrane protease YdiL (CAAX protease family)